MQEFDTNIFIEDGPKVKFYGTDFPTRMTVVKLSDASLFVHSPIPLSGKLKNEISNLGEVKYIISPNKLHYLFINDFKSGFPEAKVYATEELASKKHEKIKIDKTINPNENLPWRQDMDTFLFKTPLMHEAVFFHRRTKTLIVADLIENFDPKTLSKGAKIMAKLSGILAPNGGVPLDWKLSFYLNKQYNKSEMQKIIQLSPQKIILSHGIMIEENAKDFLFKSFAWLLK